MFLTNVLHIIKSNIKRYKDEKQLEEKKREEILSKIQKEVYDPIHGYKSGKELIENDYSAERNAMKRIKESIKNFIFKCIDFKNIFNRKK